MLELTVLQNTYAFADRIDQAPCDGCDECGARCTAGVPMLQSEYAAIRAYVDGPQGEEAREVEQQSKRIPYPGTVPTEGVFYTACRFRDVERGRCGIYPVRPLICRLFGHVEWLPCPISKVPGPTPGGPEIMLEYRKAPQHTYEEWLELSDS
jgi:hypothetical protein